MFTCASLVGSWEEFLIARFQSYIQSVCVLTFISSPELGSSYQLLTNNKGLVQSSLHDQSQFRMSTRLCAQSCSASSSGRMLHSNHDELLVEKYKHSGAAWVCSDWFEWGSASAYAVKFSGSDWLTCLCVALGCWFLEPVLLRVCQVRECPFSALWGIGTLSWTELRQILEILPTSLFVLQGLSTCGVKVFQEYASRIPWG